MLVAILTTFQANKKDPLADVLSRIHNAFPAAGEQPEIQFTFADAPLPGFVSSVDRILKRYPQLERFLSSASPAPGMASVRQISNGPRSTAPGEQVGFEILAEIARGVPRSFPIHSAQFHLRSAAFGAALPTAALPLTAPGIVLGDSWWISGRNRSLVALTVADPPADARHLPAPPAAVASILAACGKVKTTNQIPLPPDASGPDAVNADALSKVHTILANYKAHLAEIVERAQLPHDLPSLQEFRPPLGTVSGPKKPALLQAFQPMGYDCKSESGTFRLRRKTAANFTAEVYLDVGTWSNSLTGFYSVQGSGFSARLALPPARAAIGNLQFPIGDAERWRQIVGNLAALVAELDRSLIPEIEAAAGPSPAWFRP